jgi:pimeloyl-ACP methyl ester carboxylesterase
MINSAVWVGAALALVALVIVDRIAVRMIKPPLKPLRKRATGLPFQTEAVRVPSGDQALSGWIVRPERDNGGPVLVLVHGWGSNHGTMTRLARPLLERGFPVLLFDVRHHGKSGGAPYVTARHFRDDIKAALKRMAAVFPDRPTVLIGHSMGGSTGILAVADGGDARGLVTIGSPGDLWAVWAYHLDRKGLPGRWVIKCLSPFWRVRAGVPWRSLDPVVRAADLRVPFLIFHGDQDESVPADHALQLGRGSGIDPRILEGEGHTDLLDSPVLHGELEAFLQKIPAREESRVSNLN